MNQHLTDGQIRAAVDGEMDDVGMRHFDACPRCRQRFLELQSDAQDTARRLQFLSQTGARPGASPHAALAAYRRKYSQPKEISMFQKLFSSRLLRSGLAVALLLALVLSVPSTRAWAGQFLGLFRIQQITVLPIDTTGIEQLNGNSALAQQIGKLMSKSVDVVQEPGDPQPAMDAAEAGRLAGFTVRLPQQESETPKLTVTGAAAFTFTADRAKMQALIDETGRKDLVLPDSMDNAEIAVNIPASVQAAYGACPDLQKDEKTDPDAIGSMARNYGDCIIFSQMPSPTVNTPPDVNIQQLAEIALEFSGMSREQAQQFSQSVDWTNSLVIPIPRNAASYKQVSVDGVTGTLIERPSDDAPEFLLMWVKDGIVYAMAGLGNHAEEALQLAGRLP